MYNIVSHQTKFPFLHKFGTSFYLGLYPLCFTTQIEMKTIKLWTHR